MLWTEECLCPLPVAPGHRWRPNPQCDSICWWSTHKWKDRPRKEVQESSLVPFTTGDTGIRWPSLSQEMGSHQTLCFDLGTSQAYRTVRIVCWWRPTVCGIFVTDTQWTKLFHIPFVWSSRTGKSVETATRLVVAKGWGRVGGGIEVGC